MALRILENGYLELPTEDGNRKWLRFDTNAAILLKRATGKDILTLFTDAAEDENLDEFTILEAIAEIAYYAFQSHDIQHDIEIDYTQEDVNNWARTWNGEDGKAFQKALLHNNSLPHDNVGKKLGRAILTPLNWILSKLNPLFAVN